jgi:Asp-tRNA(Asn)/Glu-tRNA(Gln) amidotransferase A subunit family amidase
MNTETTKQLQNKPGAWIAITTERNKMNTETTKQFTETTKQLQDKLMETYDAMLGLVNMGSEQLVKIVSLERELAEASQELNEWKTLQSWGGTPQIVDEFIKGQQSRIHAAQDAEMQRDTLAEALGMIATHNHADGQCDNGYSPQYIAKQALAAVKGGEA